MSLNEPGFTMNLPIYQARTGLAEPLWRALMLSVIIAASLVHLIDPKRRVVWHDETPTVLRVFGFIPADLESSLFRERP